MPLRMNGCTVLNVHDLKMHFSLLDVLRSHVEFAAFAMHHAACMGDRSRVAAILFALYSLRQRQLLLEVDVNTIPGIVKPDELRRLLGEPLPAPEKASAHLKALGECLTENSNTLRLLIACGKSARQAAQYCAQSDRIAVDRVSLMMMSICALMIAERSWEDVPPGTLEDALLNVKLLRSDWTDLPGEAEMMELAKQAEPYRLRMHPMVQAAPAARCLPEGCTLRTICLMGVESKRGVGSGRTEVLLQYDARGPVQAQCCLARGEHILLDAMQDASGRVWALRLREGSGMWAPNMNGKAYSRECGSISLRWGKPDASECLVDWLTDEYLEAGWEQPVINIAVQGSEVLLHLADGTVYSSYPSRGCRTNVLFLEDAVKRMKGRDEQA